ncbi:MAG: 4a-hydroxytetrahydrobiopterin dehydratase [Candidatus Competibacterales bacterium]
MADTYSEDAARQRLAGELPQWQWGDNAIVRRYHTGNWRITLMVVNAIGHLAEAAFHHPDLEVSFPAVTVKLTTHDSGGVTDKDFALAREIEALVTWRPAADSPLDGPPDKPATAYLTNP